MNKCTYIGLDVGTSGCKAAVVEQNGGIRKVASREYGFEIPRPDWVELNPRTVWNEVAHVLRDIAPYASDAKAIAVSSIGESLVFIDKQGEPLANGIVYLDTRCADTLTDIASSADRRELYNITGVPLNQMYSLCKWIWFERNQSEVLEKAESIFMFGDYITYMLCGVRAIDAASASRTMFFDVNRLCWSDTVLDVFNIPKEKLSSITQSGAILGSISAGVAQSTGLPASLQVVMGCHDQCAATLGSGAVDEGDMMAGEGSSESLNIVVSAKNINKDVFYGKEVCFEPYVIPGTYIVPLGLLSHGTSIRWFVEAHRAVYDALPGENGESIYVKADRHCAKDSGSLFYIPYLSGSNCMDSQSKAPACFIGVDIATDVHSMYRAVLEGLSFESKSNLQLCTDLGIGINKIVASGGGAKSPLFMQMKADVIGHNIYIPRVMDSGVIGLAMVCAMATGDCSDYHEAAGRFALMQHTYVPRHDYNKKYETYRSINAAIKALYKTL